MENNKDQKVESPETETPHNEAPADEAPPGNGESTENGSPDEKESLEQQKTVALKEAPATPEKDTGATKHKDSVSTTDASDARKSALAAAFAKTGAQFLPGNDEELERLRQTNVNGSLSSTCCCIQKNSGMHGRFIVPLTINVTSVMSWATLDLSLAQFVHPISTINASSVCGMTRVKLPSGVNVELNGSGFCGSINLSSDYTQPVSGAPTVYVRGSASFAWTNFSFTNEAPPIVVCVASFYRLWVCVPNKDTTDRVLRT